VQIRCLQLKLACHFYDTTAQSARHYIDIIAVESSSSPFLKNHMEDKDNASNRQVKKNIYNK